MSIDNTLGIFLPSTTDPSARQHIKLVPPTTEGEGGIWVDLTVVKKYDPVLFLQTLRTEGPWDLFAFHPDDKDALDARTHAVKDDARNFIGAWNGTRNLYYSPNPTRTSLGKKATLSRRARRVHAQARHWAAFAWAHKAGSSTQRVEVEA